MADEPLRLPSGQGGLTRFSEEIHSKLELSPQGVMIIIGIVFVVLLLLHYFGGKFLTS
ncbi:hypothetical protein HY496_00855 [Candidatus Woesearchaeota archaeon]|nr:hypothetical protein [Candidatus Woesearchaeota archaeon]